MRGRESELITAILGCLQRFSWGPPRNFGPHQQMMTHSPRSTSAAPMLRSPRTVHTLVSPKPSTCGPRVQRTPVPWTKISKSLGDVSGGSIRVVNMQPLDSKMRHDEPSSQFVVRPVQTRDIKGTTATRTCTEDPVTRQGQLGELTKRGNRVNTRV